MISVKSWNGINEKSRGSNLFRGFWQGKFEEKRAAKPEIKRQRKLPSLFSVTIRVWISVKRGFLRPLSISS
jgi:hypothetical protein